MRRVIFILFITFSFSGCNLIRPGLTKENDIEPKYTPANLSNQTKTPTLTHSPSPPTTVPSSTPIPPTQTNTPDIPIKKILFSQGLSGGDGGIYFYDYIMYGALLPDIVLYEDGQIVIREGNWYLEGNLSKKETCSFVSSINNAISFGQASIRYNGTPTPEAGFFNGEPAVYIESVSDEPMNHIYSVREKGLLTNDFLWPFSVATSFIENIDTVPYKGEHMVLWIQTFDIGNSSGIIDIEHINAWPFYGKPNLEKIITDNRGPIIILSGDEAIQLVGELGHEPSITLYESRNIENKRYVILSRPILPHETAFDFLSINSNYGWYFGYGDLNNVCD